MSKSAEKFIGKATFAALTNNEVLTNDETLNHNDIIEILSVISGG